MTAQLPDDDDAELSSSQSLAFSTISDRAPLLHHEESLNRGTTQYDVKAWLLYLDEIDSMISSQQQQKTTTMEQQTPLLRVRDLVGRRSVAALPGSYKLWRHHWEFVLRQYARQHPLFASQPLIVDMFEKALRTLHKFPRVWMEYIGFALKHMPDEEPITVRNSSATSAQQLMYTKTTFLRKLANRALQALPVTQHQDKLWPALLECWKDQDNKEGGEENAIGVSEVDHDDHDDDNESPIAKQLRVETRSRLLRRYIQLQPAYRPTLCDFSIQHQRWGEAAVLYQHVLQQPAAMESPDYHKWWNALADLCTQHPVEVEQAGVPWEAMVRAAVSNNNNNNNNSSSSSPSALQEMQGLLWSKLADSWIRRGEFDLARSVFEEALESVSRVRDFTILFDAYLQFEEGLLEAVTANLDDEDDQDDGNADEQDKDDWDILLGTGAASTDKAATPTMADMELALARAEHLTSRRPLMLNRVLLRQNPHSVGEWLERSRIYVKQGELILAAAALEEALQTVHATKATNGSPSAIVVDLAKLYEEQEPGDLAKARDLFDRICIRQEYVFAHADDLAECYAAWVEFELRHEQWDDALSIVRSAVAPVSSRARGGNKRAINLTKSLRLWDLLLDLEESLGTTQTTKDAYNRAIEIKVATPMHILNFCSFLRDHKYFEESFTAYERGVELFAFPHPGAKLIWKAYIDAFTKRYKGSKVERTRDLFQRCLETCPPEECSEFFMLNGAFEEEFGLTKRALSVYSAMCQKVPRSEKFTAYQLYIAKTTKYLGLTATREIFQQAIEVLEDTPAAQLCLDFARMETTLQEIDRARGVLAYGAQMADPRRNPEYWKAWNEFEISHGNEETFREMLRIKRSVEAAFSTVNYNAAEMGAGSNTGNLSNEEAMQMIANREGVEVGNQQQSAPITGFVACSKRPAEVTNLDEVEERVAKLRKATAASQPVAADAGGDDEEIDIDDVDDEDEVPNENEPKPTFVRNVVTKAVPAAVFGGLAPDSGDSSKKGALERLRAAAASQKASD